MMVYQKIYIFFENKLIRLSLINFLRSMTDIP